MKTRIYTPAEKWNKAYTVNQENLKNLIETK